MELLKEITIGGLLEGTVKRYADRPAVEYLGSSWTYKQLDEQSDLIAASFLKIGIKKGVHVGIWANDRPNTLLCLYALLKIGAVPVMLGTSLSKLEIKTLIDETDVQFLLFDEGYKDQDFVKISREFSLSAIQKYIYIGTTKQTGLMTLEGLCEDGHKLSKEILAAAKSQVCASDSDMILFTSGTSGSPKGVITTHYSRVNNVRAQALVLDATYTDKFLIVLPMFHCFSLSASILAAMAVGACVCFPENRRTKTILKTIEENKCTILTAVPTLFSAILARNDIKDYDLSTLRTGLIGGSTYPPSLFRKICNELGFELLPSLGQTEATAGITAGRFSDSMEVKSQTVGRFLEHIEGSIKDMDGNLLSQGQQGEICIRGYNVMQGYYKRPDLTKMVIDNDGWLHTGDIGYIDDQLNIHLTGRIKDMIIRGGENIAPSEIEDVIADLPGIRQVKVVGVPDDHYIEEICACIVCTDDSKVTPDEIRQYLKGFLAYYKIPKHIVFIDSLPMNQNNKVDINKCKDKALQILSAQRK